MRGCEVARFNWSVSGSRNKKIKEEKNKFKNETIGFIIKVLFISGATAFVYILMRRYRSKKE